MAFCWAGQTIGHEITALSSFSNNPTPPFLDSECSEVAAISREGPMRQIIALASFCLDGVRNAT